MTFFSLIQPPHRFHPLLFFPEICPLLQKTSPKTTQMVPKIQTFEAIMKNALHLGRYFGIPVSIHWTFIFILLFFAWQGISRGLTTVDTLAFLGFILLLFVCVLLHEFGHALTARRFGIKTHSIVLLPIGGVASLEKMPDNPKEELLVALAGPAVNIVIASLLFPFQDYTLLMPENPEDFQFFKAEWPFVISYLFVVNITLVIFNLIPAFPMDGGRIFRAILSFFMPAHKATQIAAGLGQILAVGFILLGLFSTGFNPFIIIIGIFIFMGAKSESDFKQKEFYLKGYTVKDVMLTSFGTLNVDQTLQEATEKLLSVQTQDFLILKNNTYAGVLSREILLKSISAHPKDTPLGELMQEAPPLHPSQDLNEVFLIAHKSDVKMWPVMENHQLVGALDFENISEFLMVKAAIESYNNS
jgi:Zn-dependent protease